MEGAQTEPTVMLHFFKELVVRVEDLEVTRLDGGDDGITALIDAIV